MELSLSVIEKEIQEIVEADKSSWVQIYKLMTKVETQKLYKDTYSSYTQWVNKIADDMHIHVSLLWRRKKAGAFYSEYQRRMLNKGKKVSMDDLQKISPDNLVLAERIAGNNTVVADQLIDKIRQGELKRKDLSQALLAAKRCRAEQGLADPVNGYDKKKQRERLEKEQKESATRPDQRKITAMDIMAALEIYRNWVGNPIDKIGRQPRYKVVGEFGVDSPGSRNARRIDALVAETITAEHPREITLHGIEIKVSRSDLQHDEKMAEYTPYVDRFWIATPPYLVDDAEELAMPCWGILAVDQNKLSVIRPAAKNDSYGAFRDRTLAELIYKLL